jgi:hypothetical protein
LQARTLLIGLSLVLLQGCFWQSYEWKTASDIAHFERHEAAFERLADALQSDPDVMSVMKCQNVEDRACFVSVYEPTAKQLAYDAKYLPMLDDLGYRGYTFFDRRLESDFWIPNIDHAIHDDYEVASALWLRLALRDDIPMCDIYAPEGYFFHCKVRLNDRWSLEWSGYHIPTNDYCHSIGDRIEAGTHDEDEFWEKCGDVGEFSLMKRNTKAQ